MAEEDMEGVEDLPQESEKAKSGGNPWIPVAVVLILLPILSIGIANFLILPKFKAAIIEATGGADEHEMEAAHAEEAEGGHGGGHGEESGGTGGGPGFKVYEFDTIKTNLSRPSTKLIIVKFTLSGKSAMFSEKIERYKAALIDATLKRLSLLTSIDTQTPGIQNVVKNDLIENFNEIIGEDLVENLYFIDFVTQ